MPFISSPTPPDRVRAEHVSMYNDCDAPHAYHDGYLDAVKQILGDSAWFVLICDLDGNALPTLTLSREKVK